MSTPTPSKALSTKRRPWASYQLYGLVVASDFAFENNLRRARGSPDLTFTCVDAPLSGRCGSDVRELWRYPAASTDDWVARFSRCQGHHVFSYSGIADFHLFDDRIECVAIEPSLSYLIEIRLLGSMLALWLELCGVLAIHASGVVIGDEAVLFTSANHGGKTSLAAALMQAGHPLLTDDLAALTREDGVWWAHPGYPQMRMWPDEATFFTGDATMLELVHPEYTKRRVPVGSDGFGVFTPDARRLACIYFLERDESLPPGAMEIAEVATSQAMMELVRHSFVRHVMHASGLQRTRLEQFATLLDAVPVRHLRHATAWSQLPALRQLVLGDVDSRAGA